MKKFIISFCITLAVFFLGIYLAYSYGLRAVHFDNDNVTLHVQNIHDISEKAGTASKRLTIRFIEDNKDYAVTLQDFGVELTPANLDPKAWSVTPEEILYSYPEETLKSAVAGLNAGRAKGNPGSLVETEEGIRLNDASDGNMLNTSMIEDTIKTWLSAYKGLDPDELTINLSECYVPYTPNAADKKMHEAFQAYQDFAVSYTNGFTLTSDDFYQQGLIHLEDGSLTLEQEDKALPIIQKLCSDKLYGYNTVGNTYDFYTHDGQMIQVKSETYGDYIDYKEEAKSLYQMLTDFTGQTDRMPEMKQTAYSALDDTYIEVDISAQHAYYYKNKECVWDSDVVTGKMTRDRQTHTGVYFIFNKAKNVHLQKWNVDVERWMSVTYDGQGFHDASWRNAFGGNIYINNGSHGCLNTPRDNMFALYDLVEIGTPVVIY